MSDEEDLDMMYEDEEVPDEENGGAGEGEGETGVEIENEYYNAKGYIEDDINQAIKGYEKVVAMESEKRRMGIQIIEKID